MIITLFQRYYRQTGLFLLTLLGLACGLLAAALLGTDLRGPIEPARLAAPLHSPVQTSAQTDFATILQQNPFHAAARRTTPSEFSLQTGAGSPATAVRGDLELLGTVVAGSRSLALIGIGQGLKTYHLDEEIADGRITGIDRHQVEIRNRNGSLTILRLYDQGMSSQRDSSVTPVDDGAASGDRSRGMSTADKDVSITADAVRPAGNNRWIVSRRAAEAARENMGKQLQTALMQPNLVNGRTDGFVVRRVQGGTLVARMGLRRGDVIKRVNGMSIDSPEKALQIVQQLREARQLSVDLERGGKPLNFSYEIE